MILQKIINCKLNFSLTGLVISEFQDMDSIKLQKGKIKAFESFPCNFKMST